MKRNLFTIIFLSLTVFSSAQIPFYHITVFDTTASTGYYFLSLTQHQGNISILDKNGEVIYYQPGAVYVNFALHPNGMMSYFSFDRKKFFLMDSSFIIVDSIACKNLYETDWHDFKILPNGNSLLLGSDTVLMDPNKVPSWIKGVNNSITKAKYGVIQELDSNHNIVYEWRGKEYFSLEDADSFYSASSPADISMGIFDVNHFNSIEVDVDGNFIVSSRNFNEITKINRNTGELMWRFGGIRNQFKFINCSVPFYGAHDIHRLTNGHLTFFDAGNNYNKHGARAMEFELDEREKIATLIWSYTYDSTMQSIRGGGNVQRLDNSNTIVNYGNVSTNSLCFVVVKPNGSMVLKMDSIVSYRVLNYSTLPWKLHRPKITCFDSLGVKYLAAESDYRSYYWSDSSTTRTISVTKPGTYYLFVPYGANGWIRSEKIVVNDIALLCKYPLKSKNKKHKKVSQ